MSGPLRAEASTGRMLPLLAEGEPSTAATPAWPRSGRAIESILPLPLTPLTEANVARAVSTAVTPTQHSQGFRRNTRHFHTTRAPQQANLFLSGLQPRVSRGRKGPVPAWGQHHRMARTHVKMSVLVVPGCTRDKEAQEMYRAAGYHMPKTKSTLPVIIFNPLTCLPNPFAHL